jgi:hypothetical protein
MFNKIFSQIRSAFFVVVFIISSLGLFAQNGYLPRESFEGASYRLAVYEVNFEGVQNSSKFRLPYSSVKGSPFFKDEFLWASFYDAKGKLSGRQKAKMNLASQEIHFIGEKDMEYIAPVALAHKVVLSHEDKNDTVALFIRQVPGLQYNLKPLTDYVQQLTFGEAVLYKHTKRYVASADSMFGTLKRYYFASTTNYFLKLDADADYINKLSVNALLSLLPDSAGMADWIKKNKINIRKEEDLIALIEHWNQANATKR